MVGVNAGDIGTALGCAGYIWLYVVARYSAIANVQCENCFPASLFRSSAVMLPCSELASLCACFCLISSMSALIVSSHMRDTMRSTLPGRMGSLRAERRINASQPCHCWDWLQSCGAIVGTRSAAWVLGLSSMQCQASSNHWGMECQA